MGDRAEGIDAHSFPRLILSRCAAWDLTLAPDTFDDFLMTSLRLVLLP